MSVTRVPAPTLESANTITLTLPPPPDGSTGWKIHCTTGLSRQEICHDARSAARDRLSWLAMLALLLVACSSPEELHVDLPVLDAGHDASQADAARAIPDAGHPDAPPPPPIDAAPDAAWSSCSSTPVTSCSPEQVCGPSGGPRGGGSFHLECLPCGHLGELACGIMECAPGEQLFFFSDGSPYCWGTGDPHPPVSNPTCSEGTVAGDNSELWCVNVPPNTGGNGEPCLDLMVDRDGSGPDDPAIYTGQCRMDQCNGNLRCNGTICTSEPGCQ